MDRRRAGCPRLVFFLLLAWSIPAGALAEDDGDEVRRYGYQTAIMDAGAAGILTAGLLMDEPAVYWTGAFAYVAGAPLVHVAQRNRDGALMSVGVRLGAPLLLGLTGAAIAHLQAGDDDVELIEGAAPGLLVGGLLAVLVDAQILAVRTLGPEQAMQLRAVPLLGRGRAGAALTGRF